MNFSLKSLLFTKIPQLRDRNGPWRQALRRIRGRSDALGLQILVALYRIFVPFRGSSVAILPYATFAQDGFATQHDVEFLNDALFMEAFIRSCSNIPLNAAHISWRAHICCWGADHALNLHGDFVELGVWWGVLPRTVCEYFKDDPRFANRPYYLVDSWGKMPGSHPDPNYQADIYQKVQARFASYPNVKLVRGLVPEVLPKVTPPPQSG